NLDDPTVLYDEISSLAVKGIIADVHSVTGLIQNVELKNQATTVADRANTINRNLKFNR
ncbi:MAG: hypothetical protein JWQ25_3158, partial [Daejeonella sp.]|nr:hypothetical protein [Daejeonella sp.]